jgi:conjugative transfer signal peptidase TraF
MIQSRTKKYLAGAALLLGLVIFVAHFFSALLISKSSSLPYKVYFLVKGNNWQKGDVVAIKNFVTSYTQNQHFTKQIAGTAGDVITVANDYILVNGIKFAKLKTQTKDHKKLTPIVEQTIPQQCFFVLAQHNDSFDSRYQEFGLVHKDYIEGKAYPIW